MPTISATTVASSALVLEGVSAASFTAADAAAVKAALEAELVGSKVTDVTAVADDTEAAIASHLLEEHAPLLGGVARRFLCGGSTRQRWKRAYWTRLADAVACDDFSERLANDPLYASVDIERSQTYIRERSEVAIIVPVNDDSIAEDSIIQ